MKKQIKKKLFFLCYALIYLSCYFNLPGLSAYVINILVLRKNYFKKIPKEKKIFIVLGRAIGQRDIDIIQQYTKTHKFLFMQRVIAKLILFHFCKKKFSFFNYSKPAAYEKDYFNQSKNNRIKHEQFWINIILNLKKYYKNQSLNFITFNYSYYAEFALYNGCKKNNIPLKLWSKECIKTNAEANLEAINEGAQFKRAFKFFDKISVYNNLTKRMFLKIDKSINKKISINGCPRIYDYVIKKNYSKKIKNILFLSFDSNRGIPRYKKNKNLNWNLTYDKVIKMLNELSNSKNVEIIIKRKNISTYNSTYPVNKKIKINVDGTAEKFINNADIIIGQNSAATIEALVNGKYVMVPFFEKDLTIKKYLYKFEKEIVYTSEEIMKKKILSLLNKKTTFPLDNNKHKKTIEYYLGSTKNIKERYLNFLNS